MQRNPFKDKKRAYYAFSSNAKKRVLKDFGTATIHRNADPDGWLCGHVKSEHVDRVARKPLSGFKEVHYVFMSL